MQSGRNFCHFLPEVTCRYTETFEVTAVQTSNLTVFIPVNVPAQGDQDPYIAIFWVMTSFSLVGQSHSFVQNNNVNLFSWFSKTQVFLNSIRLTFHSFANAKTCCRSQARTNVKVKLILEKATKAQSGTRCIYSSTLSITSALDGGGWSMPRPGRFIPGKDPVPLV
jgi:hypothetical protein